jgi:hypothetical protein
MSCQISSMKVDAPKLARGHERTVPEARSKRDRYSGVRILQQVVLEQEQLCQPFEPEAS